MKFAPGKDRSGAIVSPKNPVVIGATILHKETRGEFLRMALPRPHWRDPSRTRAA